MAETLFERLARLLPDGKGVWIPMDHGISGYPEKGLERMDEVVDSCIEAGADAIVLQKGSLSHHFERTGWNRFVCHVSVSTQHAGGRAGDKVRVATAEECLFRGATGCSAQINLGDEYEPEMIVEMGALTGEAITLGMPVLGMVYPRGPNLIVSDDDNTGGIAHAARVAWELGCDVVKVPWTGDAESFAEVCAAVPIPILIAGGPRGTSFTELLGIVEQSISAGGAGVCMGRQVFGADDPASHIQALKAVIHEGKTATEAAEHLG
ncbi:MAG: 2-amino-3,7-dideoxy-D-threo-hept-6-ulosonate synthase [Candidatus Thalassarchaeaceae archaeon]